MSRGGKKPGAGRPKGTKRKPPTIIVTYRVDKQLAKDAKTKYGRKLNSMHGDWLKSITTEKEQE